jgi:hypothetical protein
MIISLSLPKMSRPLILRAILNFSNPHKLDITMLNNLLIGSPSLTMQKIYIIDDNKNVSYYSDERDENIKFLSNPSIFAQKLITDSGKICDKE